MSIQTHNASPEELSKFDTSTWWDLEADFRALHRINPLRLSWINSLSKLAQKRVIDVGCGGGILTESMARIGADAFGIDLAPNAVMAAQLHALETNISVKYRRLSAEAAAEEYPESFDVVTCMELLEHVPSPEATIAACSKLVRPGGYVFFSTINRTAKAFLFAIVGAEYLLSMIPKGTHRYESFIKPSELVSVARENGMYPVQLSGLSYTPFVNKYYLSNDLSVNYLVAFMRY